MRNSSDVPARFSKQNQAKKHPDPTTLKSSEMGRSYASAQVDVPLPVFNTSSFCHGWTNSDQIPKSTVPSALPAYMVPGSKSWQIPGSSMPATKLPPQSNAPESAPVPHARMKQAPVHSQITTAGAQLKLTQPMSRPSSSRPSAAVKYPPPPGPSGESYTNAFVTNEPLEPLLKQLGLGPNDQINIANIMTSYTPTPSQLAARQVMPRDLPPFSGNPTDWPVFISSYTNTTLACGYSPAENLVRLQRCLKGPAYEPVSSRLLLPESVPHILETLRLLYGRPELLINALLEKVRSIPAPKAEKLETLIDYGLAVQSLCDHLEAANQTAHLSNPSLTLLK